MIFKRLLRKKSLKVNIILQTVGEILSFCGLYQADTPLGSALAPGCSEAGTNSTKTPVLKDYAGRSYTVHFQHLSDIARIVVKGVLDSI